ncbi:3,4-dehydroadipyl-CoA semialdehyde dehydrogenase [Roseateles saccharophilus]|uniref:3,4-dehydroadipyl-CoA semialdehyde dehydrogenase n=1 Tax=Roseateles saccharophilus TaxID=304 RepID=A0A4R3UZB1_ROSSA|nr:3,4-dehydroadipyl-CoA semialdehyde dehydrogenase [Roseateles saccharophilus]MDG0832740.1 3,4-dehydroadipyl-CoA semialdehyde dehydrogenase [Roseateles saccharophilus]TCU95324.1 3,4-dehydroadipyl-CoA semialdehyde dehydrogenase [Roseateles saccharophilus]
MSTELLSNYIGGRWVAGQGAGTALFDPVIGTELVRVDAGGLDLPGGFEFARSRGGAALKGLSYRQRGELLAAVVQVLQKNRDAYYEIATANSGTVRNDSAVDIDGAIYTLTTYAKLAAQLPDGDVLRDGDALSLAKDGSFQSQHLLTPVAGLALFINAFNFPAWGLWEKAAPALLSGVPVVIKPATSTAWLTQRMVKDVVDAGVLPAGALSVVCGGSAGLLDALQPFDVLSFTGSADTAATLRRHDAITRLSVRANIEADSINSALLMPGQAAGSAAFELFVKELSREMTVKSGQKCTAIRRAFVPEALLPAVSEALLARLARTTVGNPRNEAVRMGSLVSRAQYDSVQEGIARLAQGAEMLLDGRRPTLVDADAAVACCVGPTLFALPGAAAVEASAVVHDTEVFGPVATLLPYRDLPQAARQVQRGLGSLVVSLYGDDAGALAGTAKVLAPFHGRVHVVSPEAGASQTGHGNVMPQSLHGGPGRAGGGEELGGLRALNFYHRRVAVQGAPAVISAL